MKHTLRIVLASIAVPFSQAQPANPVRSADMDWTALLALTAPAAATSSPNKTPAQVDSERTQAALVSRQTAAAARTFYQTHVTHLRAGAARKLEVVFALQGVTDTDSAYEVTAKQLAKNYREDRIQAVSDRFEVAMLAERVDARTRLGGKIFGNSPAELEKIGDKLRQEFGDVPQVFNFYASVARGADMAAARRIATNLARWPAGAEAKAEAQSILARDAMLNKTVTWTLTTIDGMALDLSRPTGKVTILYAWSPKSGSTALSGLFSAKKQLPPDSQVIYLALGGSVEQIEMQKRSAVVSGPFCLEGGGANGVTAQKLHVRQTPCVFVLNRSGVLTGFGPVGELPALITAGSR